MWIVIGRTKEASCNCVYWLFTCVLMGIRPAKQDGLDHAKEVCVCRLLFANMNFKAGQSGVGQQAGF